MHEKAEMACSARCAAAASRRPWLMELFSMRKNYNFLIDSGRSGHTLSLNGQKIATFATLDAAEAEANKVANRIVPGTTLRFELDFKWTLSDLEIRAATLQWGPSPTCLPAPLRPGRKLAIEDYVCR